MKVMPDKEIATKANLIVTSHGDANVPVDPFKIATRMGVIIEECDPHLGELLVSPQAVIIKNNPYVPPTKRRFIVAYEIGRYVLEQGKFFKDLTDNIQNSNQPNDQAALLFAAHMLLPENLLKPQVLRPAANLMTVAQYFDVDVSLVTWQLKNLGLLSKKHFKPF